jgi:hypothetical protein
MLSLSICEFIQMQYVMMMPSETISNVVTLINHVAQLLKTLTPHRAFIN